MHLRNEFTVFKHEKNPSTTLATHRAGCIETVKPQKTQPPELDVPFELLLFSFTNFPFTRGCFCQRFNPEPEPDALSALRLYPWVRVVGAFAASNLRTLSTHSATLWSLLMSPPILVMSPAICVESALKYLETSVFVPN